MSFYYSSLYNLGCEDSTEDSMSVVSIDSELDVPESHSTGTLDPAESAYESYDYRAESCLPTLQEYLASRQGDLGTLLLLPTHHLNAPARTTVQETITNFDPQRFAKDYVARIERSEFAQRCILRDYVMHMARHCALIKHQLPFFTTDINLGVIKPECMGKCELAAYMFDNEDAYYTAQRKINASSIFFAKLIMHALRSNYKFVHKTPQDVDTAAQWRTQLADANTLQRVPVNWNVCLHCKSPNVAFKTFHRTRTNTYTVAFCSIACLNAINWVPSHLQTCINTVRYGA